MTDDTYAFTSEEKFTRFEFISEGPRGYIHKLIEFQRISNSDFYNLAFGDKHPETGEMDDAVVSGNGDTGKVLATVGATLFDFFDFHPAAYVYAQGSTKARTRLYRIGITRFYKQILQDFFLYGLIGDEFIEFEPDKEYEGFLVQRKFT